MARAFVRNIVTSTMVALFWSTPCSAIVAQIDAFELVKNGGVLFLDTFSNGLTPSQEPFYAVGGSFPNGADANGLLTMNTDWGIFTTNAAGEERQVLFATFLSGPNGLTQSDTIEVFGLFPLVTPVGPLTNGYGLQVRDVEAGATVAELVVQFNPNFPTDVVRYLVQDFGAGTIDTLDFDPFVIPPGADEILLGIVRPDATNNNFYGGYEFYSGGNPLTPATIFPIPASLFVDTNFVVGRFQVFTSIPEPATLALLGVGLAGLAAIRRRKLNDSVTLASP